MSRFSPGAHIAHRSVDSAKAVVMTVLPQIVVTDVPGVIVTYLPAGSIAKRRSGIRGGGPRGRALLHWDGGYEDQPWTRTNVLMVHRPGEPFSLWTAFDTATGQVAWRYINIEEPWRRTSIGFDSRDLDLDLWAEPGSDEWHWKDEDELAWAVEAGRYSAARSLEIRAAGERALDLARCQERPFDHDWSEWHPDPSWDLALLPDGWDRYDT